MDKFKRLEGIAAPLPMINVDTDQIIPKQFLTTIERSGLGKSLFFDLRYTPDGREREDFVLNQKPYRDAVILIAGDNFGCGSSREHAPWALLDFGVRAVIAPSFADIFYNNCFKNGILPVTLPQEQIDELMQQAENNNSNHFTIDLETQTIETPGIKPVRFDLEAARKNHLLEGLDDIGITLQREGDIRAFEEKRKTEQPWI
ncbi:MAG: 3-isopropylmalate dehydratase small subunit [Hyphomicrobiales bacterium]|nr:3-isopropylmalate dehydratase small subunit [Hyphomicrobiales bacterium]MCY4048485.1 3-isopropylmalate dehydratase small subunit [Hyphomicrobiales bacterium]MCY4053593.1 3-isopropylmalate dehydratase small subunit [Hyphomicrobiales bacterium]